MGGRKRGGQGPGWDMMTTGVQGYDCACGLQPRCGCSETCFFPHPSEGTMDQLYSKTLGPNDISWKC